MDGAIDYIQSVLAPQIVIGLVLGVAVILVALGLTIIFGLLDVINRHPGRLGRRVCFIHTGGVFSVFPFRDSLTRLLDS